MEYFTTVALRASPFSNFTPDRMWRVYESSSVLIPPLVRLGTSVRMSGFRFVVPGSYVRSMAIVFCNKLMEK